MKHNKNTGKKLQIYCLYTTDLGQCWDETIPLPTENATEIGGFAQSFNPAIPFLPSSPEPAHPSLVWEQLTGAMSCPHPVPLPGWWHHLSPWGGTFTALRDKEQHQGLLILPPCRSKPLLETPLSISLIPRHVLWECQNVGISWNKAITRTDTELIPESPGEPIPRVWVCYHGCSPSEAPSALPSPKAGNKNPNGRKN